MQREIAGTEKTPDASDPSTKYSTYATDNYKAKDPVDDPLFSSQHKKTDIVDSENGSIESAKMATQCDHRVVESMFVKAMVMSVLTIVVLLTS